jgi:hypothetical protein
MRNNKILLIRPLIAGIIFFAAFLILNNSPLADSIRVKLIFRHVVIPVYQWLLIFGFIILWKYIACATWRKALIKGAILGIILCLYLPMLDAQRLVWGGSIPLSNIYVLYINAFVLAVSLLLSLAGVFAVKSIFSRGQTAKRNFFADTIFFPLFLLSVFGAFFYYSAGHRAEAIILVGALLFFMYFTSKAGMIEKTLNFTGALLKKLAKPKTLLILIFTFGLILRLIFFCNLLAIEGPRYPLASDDGDTYDRWGLNGANDPMIYLRESPHCFMVFYSVLPSLIYSVFGHDYLAVGAIQSIIGAFLCVLVFVLAYRATNKMAIALLSSLGVAINSPLIQLTTTLNTEVLYIPLLVLFVLLLLFYRDSIKDRNAVLLISLAGFTLGLAVIIRELALGIFVLAALWIFIWGRGYTKRRILKRARDIALLLVLMLLPISPITYTNYKNTDSFCLIYKREGIQWGVESAWGEELVPSNKRLIELGITDPFGEPVEGIKAFLASPKETLKVFGDIVPKRMRNLFFWANFGAFDPIFLTNKSQCANRYTSHLEFYMILLLFASFFVFAFSGIKAPYKGLIFLVIVYYAVFHGIFYLSQGMRYRSPMEPFLAIIVSFGIYKIFSEILK